MGRSAASPPSRQTNPAMQVNDISPHALGSSGQVSPGGRGHPGLVAASAHDPAGIQKTGKGVCAEYRNPRADTVPFAGRDTGLSAGGPDGSPHFQGNAKTGKNMRGPQTHAPANFDMTEGKLRGTYGTDLDGFSPPNPIDALSEANPADGSTSEYGKSNRGKK